MSHTVSRVNDCTGHVLLADFLGLRLVVIFLGDLSVKSKCSLYSNEESLDIEGLKHDLCHLLTVLRGVHGRFSQDESMVLRFALQIAVN
jgi:hypothetical protein